jgi:integration host factor subunit alpha
MPLPNKYSTVRDLTKTLAKKTGLSREAARKFVDSYFDEIKAALLSGDKVLLASFGIFETKTWKTDSIYNINTRTKTKRSIKTATFKPSDQIKQKI